MLDQEINEQLGELQKELSRLKKVTDYIDAAKDNSNSIITELASVQQNYTVYTDKIYNLYKQYVSELKQNAEIQINDGVSKFESTGNKIDTANQENLDETKRLLEHYKKIVEVTDKLAKTIEGVDFPSRLSGIDSKIKELNEGQTLNNQRLDIQYKEIKTIKIISFIICGLIVIGTVSIILVK